MIGCVSNTYRLPGSDLRAAATSPGMSGVRLWPIAVLAAQAGSASATTRKTARSQAAPPSRANSTPRITHENRQDLQEIMVVEGLRRDHADRPAQQPGGQEQLGWAPPGGGQDQQRQSGQIERAPAQRLHSALRNRRPAAVKGASDAPEIGGDAGRPPQAEPPMRGIEQSGERHGHGGAE